MNRREFTRSQKAAIVHRAMNERGVVCCEKCRFVLGAKPYDIDHRIAEALIVDKTKPLTIEDGWLLGRVCCHAPKTVLDKGIIAKGSRREARHLGIPRSKSRPLDGTKASGWRKKLDGTVERRT